MFPPSMAQEPGPGPGAEEELQQGANKPGAWGCPEPARGHEVVSVRGLQRYLP